MNDVFDELRAAILRGEFAPLQRLIETELAERFGTSRFVLRNALTRLAAEGLVELQPNRGARVREISVEEAIEITEPLVAGRPAVSLPEHLAIIDAVCARDPKKAERAMRAHLTSVIEALSKFS